MCKHKQRGKRAKDICLVEDSSSDSNDTIDCNKDVSEIELKLIRLLGAGKYKVTLLNTVERVER